MKELCISEIIGKWFFSYFVVVFCGMYLECLVMVVFKKVLLLVDFDGCVGYEFKWWDE